MKIQDVVQKVEQGFSTIGFRTTAKVAKTSVSCSRSSSERRHPLVSRTCAGRASPAIPGMSKSGNLGWAILLDDGMANSTPRGVLEKDDVQRTGGGLVSDERGCSLVAAIARMVDMLLALREGKCIDNGRGNGAHFVQLRTGFAPDLDRRMPYGTFMSLLHVGAEVDRAAGSDMTESGTACRRINGCDLIPLLLEGIAFSGMRTGAR
ncbi:hypothetical protein AB4Y42_38095 [Paraburkholderia sp. EG286B]|uniref:hypothetical protein n=1 Tax=Paraburkholderia sp. EG286B TaxID=3237011 RepID=UPI0034D154A4